MEIERKILHRVYDKTEKEVVINESNLGASLMKVTPEIRALAKKCEKHNA